MRIGIIATDGCFTSGIAALIDVLSVAESARPAVDASVPAIDVGVVGLQPTVTTGAGFVIQADLGVGDIPSLDVVVVPAFGTMDVASTNAALEDGRGRALLDALSSMDPRTTTAAAACTGVFALAEVGLLDDRRATTSWWLGAAFRRRYPRVELELDTMVVADRGTLTAGAAFAHTDLALALVGRASPALAAHVARLLVIDQRPSQGAYMRLDHLDHDDQLVRAFQAHARDTLAEPVDMARIASAVGTSRRTLERRTQAALGMSPLSVIRRLRVERARHLLDTTDQTVEQVARQVGYANASTLRSLLRQHR